MKLREFVLNICKPYSKYFYAMAFVGIYSSLHMVIEPYILKMLLDAASITAIGSDFVNNCFWPAVIFIVMSFVINYIWRFYSYLNLKSVPGIRADIITVTTDYLRGHPYKFFQNNLSGAIGAKINSIVDNLFFLINTTLNVTRQGLSLLLSIILAFVVHPYFAGVFAIVSIAFIIIAYYSQVSITPYAELYAESRSKNSGIIVDCFANVLNMFMFAREDFEKQYLANSTDNCVACDQAMQKKNLINSSILCGISFILISASTFLLIYLGSKQLITIGDFVLIFMLSKTVIEQAWNVAENLLSMGEKIGICQQALNSIFIPHCYEDVSNKANIDIPEGNINFKNVSFTYKNGEDLFRGKNILIQGGKKTGLVGTSGSGKSTFVNLISRLYDIQSGDILIDDQSI